MGLASHEYNHGDIKGVAMQLQTTSMLWDSQLIHGIFNIAMGGSPFSLPKVVDPYWLRLLKQCRLCQKLAPNSVVFLHWNTTNTKPVALCGETALTQSSLNKKKCVIYTINQGWLYIMICKYRVSRVAACFLGGAIDDCQATASDLTDCILSTSCKKVNRPHSHRCLWGKTQF